MPTFALDDATLDRLRDAALAAGGGAAGGPVVLTDRRGRPAFTLAGPPDVGGSTVEDAPGGTGRSDPSDDPTGFLTLERHLRGLPADPYAEFGLGVSSADMVRDIRLSMERGESSGGRTATQIIAGP